MLDEDFKVGPTQRTQLDLHRERAVKSKGADLATIATPTRGVTVSVAARILGINQATVRRWADEGVLTFYLTPGGHRRFPAEQLENPLTEREHALIEAERKRQVLERAGDVAERRLEIVRWERELTDRVSTIERTDRGELAQALDALSAATRELAEALRAQD